MRINDLWVPIVILVGALLLGLVVSAEAQQVWVPGPGSGSIQTWTETNTGRTKTFIVPRQYRGYGYGGGCNYCNPVDGFLQSYMRAREAGAIMRQQRQKSPRSSWGYDGE